MNTLDYILIIIFLLAAIRGYRRGFFASLTAIVGVILALFVAWRYRDFLVANLEAKYNLVTLLANWLEEKLPLLVMARSGVNFLDQIPLPGSTADPSMPMSLLPVSIQMAENILGIAAFVILFAGAYCVLKVLAALFTGLFKHGALGWVNSLGGMILETAKYVIIVLVLVALISPLLQTAAFLNSDSAGKVSENIENSRVMAFLYDGFDGMENWFMDKEDGLSFGPNLQ